MRQRPLRGWQLRQLPVCASTELELEAWLRQCQACGLPLPGRLVVRADRQRFGRGQQGRLWQSPAGGVWLSAAFPWPEAPWPAGRGAALGLAVAVGLMLQLEELGLAPQLKWPNDLLLGGRKLAGVLPRLRLRGSQVRWAQVGLGLNGVNAVPAGAISLAAALTQRHPRRGARPWHPQAVPLRLQIRVLVALDWAIAHAAAAETVRQLAEQRLRPYPQGLEHAGRCWQVEGLELDGSLRLRQGALRTRLQRTF